jgi:hypothetical protein
MTKDEALKMAIDFLDGSYEAHKVRKACQEALIPPLDMLGYELDGVICDVEMTGEFDDVCLGTIKRVREALATNKESLTVRQEREQFDFDAEFDAGVLAND